MTDPYPAHRTAQDGYASGSSSRYAEQVRTKGQWITGLAFVMALLWIGGVGFIAVGFGGLALLERYRPEIAAGVVIVALMPAVMIIMAGYMARTGRRAGAANALVLEAASRLMAPAREAGIEAAVFADQMKLSASDVEAAMNRALGSMKLLASELGDERARLESVSLAAADNTRDLANRLSEERRALETLARDLRQQLTSMNEMMVRQAQLMVSATRAAGEEAGRAEAVLADRVVAIERAGEDLGRRLEKLDGVAGAAAGRTASFAALIGELEARLLQAQRSVDAAVKASQEAVSAAAATGEALQHAVSAATGTAHGNPAAIDPSVTEAAGDVVFSLSRLREAPRGAAAEQDEAGSADPNPGVSNGSGDTSPPQISMSPRPGAGGVRRAAAGVDDDLFEVSAEAVIAASRAGREIEPGAGANDPDLSFSVFPVFSELDEGRSHEPAKRGPERADHSAGSPPRRRASDFPENLRELSAPGAASPAWREIISDISRNEDWPEPDRESVAEAVIERLQSSGIPLAEVFRPKSKRRIAEANARGSEARFAATIEQGGKQFDRVVQRLRGDPRLAEMARQFVRFEGQDALAALEQTQATGRNASPRLAAFLLLEAAL